MIKQKATLFFHKLSLAWLSCMLVMVQGDVSSLTTKHAMIATKTGALVMFMSFIPIKFYMKLPVFMFIGCFIADYITHPSHFGPHFMEALVTAGMAATFSYIISLSPAGKKLEEYLGG